VIVLGCIGLVVVLSAFVPPLDEVGKAHTVSMSPNQAGSMQAMKRVGKVFDEFDTDSAIMIVLVGTRRSATMPTISTTNLSRSLRRTEST
jgi:RND superfamily putative drug exporter